jgi:hypothetical protein
MVGRRGRGNNRLRNFAVIAVVITIGVIVAVTQTPVGDFLDEFELEIGQPTVSWFDDLNFFLAVAPNAGVNCNLALTMLQDNTDGTRTTFSSTSGNFNPIFTTASVIGSSGKEITQMIMTAVLVCEENPSTLDFNIELQGGTVSHKTYIYDQSGIRKLVKSIFLVIPSALQSLEGAGVFLPSTTVTASLLESASGVTAGSPSLLVEHQTEGFFNIKVFTTVSNTGQKTVSGTNRVQIIPFVEPTDPEGTQVNLDSIIPNKFIFVGSSNEEGLTASNSKEKILIQNSMFATIKGRLDNWKVSEGFPIITITNPSGGVTATSEMTQFNIGSLYTEFTLPNFRMSPTISDSNIDQNKGIWKVAMKSKNDVRRITDTLTFILQDARGTAPPLPPSTCDPPLVSDGMGGCKMGDPTVIIPVYTCISLSDMGIFITSATNSELLAKKVELDELQDQGNTQLCVTQFLTFVNQEIATRGVTTTEPSMANAFIEFISRHSPKGSEQSGCTIPTSGTVGRLPSTGIQITGFGLLGLGTCEGNSWGSTEIDVVIDFGDDVKEFIVDTSATDLEHKLFISVNNPYPSNPTFSCPQNPSNPDGNPICIVNGHNHQNDKVGDVGLTVSEVQEPSSFIDQQGGDPRLTLADVTLQANSIKDKIQKDHILLDGDKVEVLYFSWGKFGGTFKGTDVVGAYTPLYYIQKFTWDDQGVQTKCPEGENLREDRTCKPIGEDICETPNKKDVNGVCRAPTTTTTTGTMVEGVICEASLPENQPVCTAEQNQVPTGNADLCDIPFFECKAKDDPNVVDKPDTTTMPREVEPNADGGCPAMYTINTATGKCQIIGGGDLDGDDDPAGGGGSGGVCDLATFNFGSCFAKIIQDAQTGLPSFNLPTGIEPIIFLGIAVVAIILVAVGIIIRRRRSSFGGGF